MDQKRCPGNFILEIANTGVEATATLARFGPGYRIKNIANSASLSAGLLLQVGRDVNEHEQLFKDNFKQKFEGALLKCKTEYEKLVAAVEKVNSFKKDESDENAETLPKSRWKKLAWGLGMTNDEFSDFEDELDESYKIAMMAQVIVQLVILQVHAQQRELTSSEYLLLRRVKKAMGDFLELLHETGVGSVMVFSLTEPTKPANAAQIAEATEVVIDDNESTADSITIRNPSIIEIPAPSKKGLSPPPPPPPAPPVEPVVPYKAPDIFEMHRAVNEAREKKANQTIFRFLGIPIRINRTETQLVSSFDKVPVSQDEIKAVLEKHKQQISKKPAIETLMGVSPATSTAVYAYLATKTDPRTFQSHTWSVECVLPAFEEKPRRFWRKKISTPDSHVIVLRGTTANRPGWGPYPRPGPPPGWRGIGSPPVIVGRPRSIASSTDSDKPSKKAAKFELSQQETENVINDYLASFSTLYDGIPVEERGAALKAIVLPEGDDSDYDSDGSSSSGSLVDD